MPRSFLVKKVKLDDFSPAELEGSYGRSRNDFGSRLHDKGERGRRIPALPPLACGRPQPSCAGRGPGGAAFVRVQGHRLLRGGLGWLRRLLFVAICLQRVA